MPISWCFIEYPSDMCSYITRYAKNIHVHIVAFGAYWCLTMSRRSGKAVLRRQLNACETNSGSAPAVKCSAFPGIAFFFYFDKKSATHLKHLLTFPSTQGWIQYLSEG